MSAKKRSTDPSTARCIITGRSVSPYRVAYVSVRQRTSAHVSIRQHTYTYVSIRQHIIYICMYVCMYVCIYIYIKLSDLDWIFCMEREVEPLWQLKIELYGSTLVSSLHSQKGSAYVSIREHTWAYALQTRALLAVVSCLDSQKGSDLFTGTKVLAASYKSTNTDALYLCLQRIGNGNIYFGAIKRAIAVLHTVCPPSTCACATTLVLVNR